MYTTIDFDKYNVPAQNPLRGMNKVAAPGAGLGDAIKTTFVTGVTGKAVDEIWKTVDTGFLKKKFVPTPEAIYLNPELLKKPPKGMISEAEQLAARRKLKVMGATAGTYGAYKALKDPANRKAIRDAAMRAVGKNPNKNRDRALVAGGALAAGAGAYSVARHRKQQQANANFDRQYGYGDYYYGSNRKYASVEDAFKAGYDDAIDMFTKEASMGANIKNFFMTPYNAVKRRVNWAINHPSTVWSNMLRSARRVPKPPKTINPMQAWNSMNNNAKWMTGVGVAGLGAGAYHMGATGQRKVEIR